MKKILLTLSLFVACIGATFSQSSAIWEAHNINVDTSRGIRWMHAVDTNIVWALTYDGGVPSRASNVFVKTGNGNVFTHGTFMPDTNRFNSSNISAIDSMTAFIALFDKAADGTSGRLIKTTDGGMNWTLISDTTTMYTGATNFPDFVHFWDANNGLALGDPNGNTSGSGTEFEIYRTHNGGTSWTRVPDANIPNPVSGEFGLTNGFFTLGAKMWFTTNKAHVFRSSDSGKTWSVSTAIPGLAGQVEGVAFRDTLNGLTWGRATTSATSAFNIAKTINGGATWTAVTTTTTTQLGTNDICVVPGKNTYMSVGVNKGGNAWITSTTSDDGTTWNVLESVPNTSLGNEYALMLQVQMLDSLHGWAGCFSDTSQPVGKNGMDKYRGPKILQACPINISASKTTLCSGDSSMLTASGASTYTWTTIGVNTSTVTVKPTAATVYTVSGTIPGCTSTQTVNINVNPTPTLTITDPYGASLISGTVCTGGSEYLTAAGAVNYTWSPSGTLSATTGTSTFASPTVTTTYSLTGKTGTCTKVATFTVTVLSTPSPVLIAPSTSVCLGSSVTLNASGLSSYSWTPSGSLNMNTGNSVISTPSVTTVYIVTGYDGSTCKTSTSLTVTVNTCAGIESVSNNADISVYPNPSTGLVTISMPSVNETTTLYITDMIGKEVFKSTVKNANMSLDLTNLQKGLYMLTIYNGKNKQVQKLVIQ
ncbi:MAG TPA: T9SS type A sorting domain-containing protein [Bacteroidia bacterium]|nr:T9SS type A sorting domain-containing protein [Bacteroidia bacterium]